MSTYKQFTKDRDKALNDIHTKQAAELTNISFKYFGDIIKTAQYVFSSIEFFSLKGRGSIKHLNLYIDDAFTSMAYSMLPVVISYKKIAYNLMGASELEALARLKQVHGKRFHPKLKINEEKLMSLIQLSLKKTQDKIKTEIERAYVSEDKDVAARIKRVLPKKKRYKRGVLVREANYEKKIAGQEDMTTDFIPEDEWTAIVDAYKADYLPEGRFVDPETGEFPKTTIDGIEFYDWELENLAVSEYLDSIKDGTNEAAKEAGVTDLMWVAVLDDKTREEHARRDGLTSSEIEEKLNTEWTDDPYDSVAPSGFNCLTSGHKIKTINGEKPIEQVEIDDLVLTHKNQYRPVERVLKRKADRFVRLTVGGQELFGTTEHPVLTERGFIEMGKLRIDDKVILCREVDENGISCKELQGYLKSGPCLSARE